MCKYGFIQLSALIAYQNVVPHIVKFLFLLYDLLRLTFWELLHLRHIYLSIDIFSKTC